MSTRIWFLMGRKLAGEATLDELRELDLLLLHDEELRQSLKIHEKYFSIQNQENENTIDQSWKKLQPCIDNDGEELRSEPYVSPVFNNRRGVHLFKKRLYAVAAIISFLIVGIGIVFFYSDAVKGDKSISSISKVTIHTSKQEKVRQVLPDGSIIWLNKGSTISYDDHFNKTNRSIELKGEAFFDVAHKAALPMTVFAGGVQVRVKGTAFNVRAYEDEGRVETSLIRGSVELFAIEDNEERKILMKPNDKVSIKTTYPPIQKVLPKDSRSDEVFEFDSLSAEASSGLIPEISWIQNKFVFNNETFTELCNRLSKWYNVEIELDNASLSAERFTGVFHGETLEEALEALQLTYHFHYRREANKVVITKK